MAYKLAMPLAALPSWPEESLATASHGAILWSWFLCGSAGGGKQV